jgi:transcriptional regulator with XRE-family HTH domain
LREKAGLTVEELAEKSGVPRLTLYRWEQAYTMPSFGILPHFAESLGVTVRTLMPQK